MKYYILAIFLAFLVGLPSCKKFLDAKSDQKLSTPSTIDDLQLMLDDPTLVTTIGLANTGTDEFYLLYDDWRARLEDRKLSYVWDPQLNNLIDWTTPYQKIFVTNTVLFNLENLSIKESEQTKANIVKGSALFIRAYNFFQLAQYYAPQYNSATASIDHGIVLRLTADHSEKSTRSTVQQTYYQIIRDLETASTLLPNNRIPKNRPNKVACYALLAKVYLQMENYPKAFDYSDACLQLHNTLIDYNSLSPFGTGYTFSFNNPEIIYYSKSESPVNVVQSIAKVDSLLYTSYAANDLRKQAFFRKNTTSNTYAYRGNYSGEAGVMFNGLATDEIYLIKAEANVRNGNVDAGLQELTTLMKKRFATGTFTAYPSLPADQALALILQERKKELVNRGTRWLDLRRLNKDSRFAITLKRNLNGQIFELPPNDLRYTLLIPYQVLNYADLPQNPR